MSKPKAGQAGTDTVETRLLQRIGELETALAEAKRTLKSKRDGERRLRSLIDQASDPIFCYEANPPFSINLPLQEQIKRFYDCILVDCNEACAQAYGIESPKQAVGSKLTDLFGMRPGSLDKLFTEMIEGGYRTVDGEVTEILPDGRKRFYRNNGHAVIEDGKLMRVWGTFRDVTAQKLAENALQNNKHFLEDVVNSIQDGISVLDTNLNILLVNKNMEDWYAHHTPLQGKKCFHCYQEREQPCDPCPSVRAMQSGKTEVNIVPGSKGSHVEWIELFGFPIRDRESGEITGVVEFVRNISEKLRLERQLLQAQKLEAVGTLAGGIAHDFNNLLMSIQGQASLMLSDTDESHPYHHYLKGIETSVKSASDLTRQLLGFSRGGKYEVTPTNMNQVIENMTEMFGRTKKEISISKKFEKKLWTVEVDCKQIENVLLNLFINAWQAMPGGGAMYIQTENVHLDDNFFRPHEAAAGRYVKITVTDTGHGMDEHTQQRVFDPFFTTKKVGTGTGLGLASAFGIIKNHNGLINVDSAVGKGTTITIYLPASEKEVAAQASPVSEVKRGTGTILLVDDEPMVLEVGKEMLLELGYTVIAVNSGQEAIRTYEREKDRINLVILDMIMPEKSGSDTFDRLKELNPNVQVLLSSGCSADGQAQSILEKGCEGFLQKPFDLIELSGKLHEILNT